MICTLILAASLASQVPQPPAAAEKATQARRLIAKRKAKKTGAYVASLNRDEANRQASLRAAEAAQKQYEKMLPYLLENQRQQLAATAASERTAALQRMASAMEKQAGYSYPGQSPVVGPYPQSPPAAPVNPLYAPLMSPP